MTGSKLVHLARTMLLCAVVINLKPIQSTLGGVMFWSMLGGFVVFGVGGMVVK